jgi:hypothetical protein
MTDQELVRLLISDVGGTGGKEFIFSEAEIDGFLQLGEGSPRQAAAEALRAIAGNEAQVSKRIEYLELKTDGPAVAKALRELADSLEERADSETSTEEDIEIADMVPCRYEPPRYPL